MLPAPYSGTRRVTFDFGKRYWNFHGLLGKRHEGVDLGMPCGTALKAQGDGYVVKAFTGNSSWGNHIRIRYGAIEVMLAHLSVVAVQTFSKVKAGTYLGRSGTSGWATGCHLHIGVIDHSKAVHEVNEWDNPRFYYNLNEPVPAQPAPANRTYNVVRGDTLWWIAARQLGNGARWPEIYNLNKGQIKNPSLIYPGQRLTIPGR